MAQPILDRASGLLGDLELHRSARFLLNDRRAGADATANTDIVNPQPHEITTSELAVDREIEQREVAGSVLQLEPNSDRPHVLGLQGALLTNEASFVPWVAARYRRLVCVEYDPLLGTNRA